MSTESIEITVKDLHYNHLLAHLSHHMCLFWFLCIYHHRFVKHLINGTLSGLRQFLATESSKNDEECFLFRLKSSFHFQDI